MKTNKEYLEEKMIEELYEELEGGTITIDGVVMRCSQCNSTTIRLVKNNTYYCPEHAEDKK